LDRVTKLSVDLQRMGRWNFWTALSTGIAVFLQMVTRFLLEPRRFGSRPNLIPHPFDALPGCGLDTSAGVAVDDFGQLISDVIG
jgi:hypothetical protein